MTNEIESRQQAMWAEGELEGASERPAPVQPEAQGEPRLQGVNRQQMVWRTVDVERLIAEDPRLLGSDGPHRGPEIGHPARAIWELVGNLDLSSFRQAIGAVEGVAGRPALDPQLLISLWIYAYSEGVSSAREISRRCEFDPAYQWLTGLEGVNYHSLSDFRVGHQAALDELFTQVLGVLSAEGLLSLQRVMSRWQDSDEARSYRDSAIGARRDEGEGLGGRRHVAAGRDDPGPLGTGPPPSGGDGRPAAGGIEPAGGEGAPAGRAREAAAAGVGPSGTRETAPEQEE